MNIYTIIIIESIMIVIVYWQLKSSHKSDHETVTVSTSLAYEYWTTTWLESIPAIGTLIITALAIEI